MMLETLKPVGATVTVLFHGEHDPIEGYYIHFGDCPSEEDQIDDSNVFFYAQDEEDLKQLMVKGCLDFVVLSYSLEY